jgi:hypothetical protein
MLDDPSEPAFVRELLQAGAEDQVTDYDYDKGLAKHLTIIAAGALLPIWAKGLISGSGTSSTVSGLSAKVIAFVVGLPIVTAGVVASIVISNQEPEMRPANTSKSVPAQTSQNSSLAAPQEVAPLDGVTTSDPEASDMQIPLQPTTAKESLEPLYPKPTTNRTVRSATTKDRRVVKKIRSRELSSSKPVDLELDRGSNIAIRQTTKKREKKQLSSTPVIGRRAVSELRREQAKEPRAEENPFERETRMLAAANRLLESDPERSLELAKKGEREFPGSMFTEERRHVLILALIKLSRLDEARRLAGPYLLDYPKSPFAQRVRHALAKAQREE